MNIQLLIVLAVFAGALFFIGRRFYLQLFKKKTAGCADCKAGEITGVKSASGN